MASYRRSRRTRTSNKDVVLAGLMGAGIGAMNYKLQEWTTKRAEEAEMRKAERLEQIQIAREGRQFEMKKVEDERNFGQQKEVIDIEGKMRKDLTATELAARERLADKENANALTRQGMMIGANREEIGLREQSQLRLQENEAKLRQKYNNTDGVWGSDNKWYPTGTPIPTGITPMVGAGVSALTRTGQGGLSPLTPGAKPITPKPPAGWSATILDEDD